MKSNYQNADDLCLKYVLDELDPSEVLVVEKMMTEDENVLIDVESMRQTLNRLDQLPKVNPPEHIRQQILVKATEHARNGSSTIPIFSLQNRVLSWAAAAVVVVGLGFAGYSVTFDTPANTAATTGQETVAEQEQADAAGQNINPWVDRNEVLQLNAPASAQTAEDGLQNLRPVENTTQPISPFREIQLTRDRKSVV